MPSAAGGDDEAASPLPAFLREIGEYDREFILYDNGWRAWSYSYQAMFGMAAAILKRLETHGLTAGDHLLIWSESRPGWLAVLWASLLGNYILVPVEPQSSLDLCQRIIDEVNPKVLFLGERVNEPITREITAWNLRNIEEDFCSTIPSTVVAKADDVAEIVFTSGTTATPKGVLITHSNLVACMAPIEAALAPYRKYLQRIKPLRILDLLPMSHLFGQATALLIVPIIPAAVVFLNTNSPQEIARQIRRRNICAVVSVPRVLEVLREYVLHEFPEAAAAPTGGHWMKRVWRHRAIHRFLGWRFCCFVVGGAPLPRDVEEFWRGLGYVVAQGYGLTETAPIISFNNPFHTTAASAGRPMTGTEVRIAEDGEILVKGQAVTPGYFRSPNQTAEAFDQGWLRTGDIGSVSESGELVIRGRKKDVIVTPEGLKVHPEDVEAQLNQMQGVRESAIVDRKGIHAVLILDPCVEPEAIITVVNSRLEAHQRIRSYSLWQDSALPRTSTGKLKRSSIAAILGGQSVPVASHHPNSVLEAIKRRAPGRVVHSDTTLDELGLTSLDRVELSLELEDKLNLDLDEDAFAEVKTVGQLEQPQLLQATPLKQPRYNRTWIAGVLRRLLLPVVFLPWLRHYARITVKGVENIRSISGPVIFAANHQSFIDTGAILAALPAERRFRTATAMWLEFFDAHFFPEGHTRTERWMYGALYVVVSTLFSAFPLSQSRHGTRQSLRYAGELIEEGWSVLLFPEGERTRTGELGMFYPGTAMLATHARVPVVPVRIVGMDGVLHRDWKWPRCHSVEIRFGKPLILSDSDYTRGTNSIKSAISSL